MPWKTMDVREQRIRFVVAALRSEQSLSNLCREFGVSRPTGRLWLERYRSGGVEAIAERSRRPHHSPRQTAVCLEQRVVELRRRYPDWGARKLQVLLDAAGTQLTASTIHRILLRHGMVHSEDRHRPAPQRFERATPNELWQMDFKGPKSWHQTVGPLSILDDHSRYVIALEALGSACGCQQRSGIVVDETRHTAALERHRTSADARQGGALSRHAATRARQ